MRIVGLLILSLGITVALPAADGAAPTDAGAKPAASSDNEQTAFAIITLSADKHTITLTDGKAAGQVLTLTDKTTYTRELKSVKLGDLQLDEQVRVTYRGTTVVSIDQLAKEKKKKKKTT
jgi:hypothetical protein